MFFDLDEIESLTSQFRLRAIKANREGTIEKFLLETGFSDLIQPPPIYSSKDGKIVVLGASELDEEHILMTAGKFGIDKSRIEMCLDYKGLQKYNYRKLQYTDKYRLVLVGPIPHSSVGMCDSSSVIAEMEKHPEIYPRVIRLTAGDKLKITKASLKGAFGTVLSEGYI